MTRPPPSIDNGEAGDSGSVPDHLREVAKWDRRLLWWGIMLPLSPGLLALLNLIPSTHNDLGGIAVVGLLVGMVLSIPLQAFLVIQLAKAMDRNPLAWCLGTFVPYAGFLVMLLLNSRATSVLKTAGLRAPLFRSWRPNV